MKEKRDCKIVQDLLPNYIEKLTNEETNQFVEEHLKQCEECKKMHENMKKELEINTNQRDKREVKYIKKFSNKLRILKMVLLVTKYKNKNRATKLGLLLIRVIRVIIHC